MQPLLSAAQKSKTLDKLVKMGELQIGHTQTESLGPIGTQYHEITPFINISGAPASKAVTLKWPSGSGFLYDESIGFLCTCTVDASDVTTAPVAYNIVRQLEVISNGNLVLFKTGEAMLAQIKRNKNAEFQSHALRYSRMLNPNDDNTLAVETATSFRTYLARAESYLDEWEKALLTNVIGDLQIRITFNDTDRSGLVNAITAIEVKGYAQTFTPTPSALNQVITKDWNSVSTMNWMNTDTEQSPLTTTSTLTNYVFTSPYFVTRTDILIKRISKVTDTTEIGAPLYAVTKINSLVVGGIPYITDLPVSRLTSNAARKGVANYDVTSANAVTVNNDMISIDWSVLCSADQESGGIFFSQLRDTKISLTFDSTEITTIGEVNAFFVHHYEQMVDFHPSNGTNGYLQISELS